VFLPAFARANDVVVRRDVAIFGTLSQALGIYAAPGLPNHLFIVQKSGQVRVADLNVSQLLPTSFLALTNTLQDSERGLYAIAFHPQYDSNGYFWLYFVRAPGETVIVRGRRSVADPFVADATFDDVLVMPSSASFHQGGFFAFGPDGLLYTAVGDNTNPLIAQDLNSLRGKILRLDVDGPDNIPGNADDDEFPADPSKNYSVPPTNPYVGISGLDEIWASGLRNPFRGSFDRATGDLWIGDVGAESREEVTMIPAGLSGRNLGWPCREGFPIFVVCNPALGSNYLPPVFDFGLNGTLPIGSQVYGGFRYVIGGYVYRGSAMPCLQGTYFFADGATGVYSIRRGDTGAVTDFVDRRPQTSSFRPTCFGESLDGELYTCNIGDPWLYKIVFDSHAGNDCDADTLPDACEIRLGYTTDTNGNTTPDQCEGLCIDVDFNNDGVAPDTTDITDLLAVFGGASCPGVHCDSIDFNGDGVAPDTEDLTDFLSVFGGGGC
jgi:hypothetical protein